MVTAQDAFLIVFGLLACFMGYTMFREMLPLWGFVLGGWIAFTLLPTIVGPERAGSMLITLVVVVVGAIIGAIISTPLYFVIVFLSGAVLGMLFGVMAGALVNAGGISTVQQITTFTMMSFPPMPQTGLQYLLAATFGLVMGALSINFQKFMICASSAFIGSAGLVSGLIGPITQISTSDIGRAAVQITVWMVLGLLGLFVQFHIMGDA